MEKIQPPVVAGLFYPEDPAELKEMIKAFLADAKPSKGIPKAIISPHAGYVYSGPIAASAYAALKNARDQIKEVILLGPCHRFPFSGLALPDADFFETPLGKIPVDRVTAKSASLQSLPYVQIIPEAFLEEHSLEVQLPFLQMVLSNFKILPILVGFSDAEQVATVLEKLWNGKSTLIVISSDLSHYLPYRDAQKVDEETAKSILSFKAQALKSDSACGKTAIAGLLQVAHKKQLSIKMIDLRNSGDTQGGEGKVVGYGAFHIYEE